VSKTLISINFVLLRMKGATMLMLLVAVFTATLARQLLDTPSLDLQQLEQQLDQRSENELADEKASQAVERKQLGVIAAVKIAARIVSLGSKKYSLHRWGKDNYINIGPYPCVGNVNGHLSKWKWVWAGKFKCPTLANVEGRGRLVGWKSRQGAIKHAIQDLLDKLKAGNYLTPEQWTNLLQGVNG